MLLSVLKTTIGKVLFLNSQIVKWVNLPDNHFARILHGAV